MGDFGRDDFGRDELERDLRSTFDHLADGAVASEQLVERTVARSARIRRNRRLIAASGTAAAFVAVIAIVSIAGAATRGHVHVSTPSIGNALSSTTVSPPTTTPTTAHPGKVPTRSTTPGFTAAPTPTTMPAPCNPPDVSSSGKGTFTLQADGDIRAQFAFPFAAARAAKHEVFDNGTTGGDIATTVYPPAEFGQHWIDTWSVVGTTTTCTQRLTFDVDPATATVDTTPTTTAPETTTTVDPTVTTTAPTTVPETTTTVG